MELVSKDDPNPTIRKKARLGVPKEKFTVKNYNKALNYLVQQVGGEWVHVPKDVDFALVDGEGNLSFFTKEGVVETVNEYIDESRNHNGEGV